MASPYSGEPILLLIHQSPDRLMKLHLSFPSLSSLSDFQEVINLIRIVIPYVQVPEDSLINNYHL